MPQSDNIIMYLRKSRSDNPDMTVEEVLSKHEEQLQEFACAELGGPIPESHIYREVVSGETIADRPVMREVMRLLETGTIHGVLVIEPQRLSRGDMQDCGTIINAFRYTNTLVITPPKTYNIQDEYDRKFFELELTRGNDYLEYTKKILNRGKMASVRKGHFVGSVAPYGYKKVTVGTGKDTYHTLEIIPEEAEIVRLMFHLYVHENYGFTRIARHLDSIGARPRKAQHWSPAAIKDMIENPVYIGKIRWNWRKTERHLIDGEIIKSRPKTKDESEWIYVDGMHPAIIDEDLFYAALNKRGTNIRVCKGKELKNPFAGLLFCGTCGRSMSLKPYTNRSAKEQVVVDYMLCNNQAICHTHSARFRDILDRVESVLEEHIANFEVQLKRKDDNSAQFHANIVKNLEFELQKLREKDARQKDALDDGIYTKEEYLQRNMKVQEQIYKTLDALDLAKSSALPFIDYQEKLRRFKDCLSTLRNPDSSPMDKNTVLKQCIEKIVYINHCESRPGIGRYMNNVFELEVFLKI